MQIEIRTAAAPAAPSVDVSAAICFQSGALESNEADWLRQSDSFRRLSAAEEFTGELYDSVLVHWPPDLASARLLLMGGGCRATYSTTEARRLAGAIVRFTMEKRLKCVALHVAPSDVNDDGILQALVEGAILAAWRPGKYKTDHSAVRKDVTFVLYVPNPADPCVVAAVERGRIIADAQNQARELVSEPPNRQSPRELVRAAEELSESGIMVELFDRRQMAAMGLGALLAVAQGSSQEPYLAALSYRPECPTPGVHLALIGKGVTFDSGGVCLKAGADLPEMKYDMSGAAAVIAAMGAIARLRADICVTGYIGAVENMVGPNAQRPGDIVTTLSGKTVEVVNTDAEGRLLLADLLTYAKSRGATHLVDIATLTDAVDIALGRCYSAAFANDDGFFALFDGCASRAGEEVWRLPLHEHYASALHSPFADLKNYAGRTAGAIMAATFLKTFADPEPWIHIDIAATAWTDDPEPWTASGPTGVGVRTLTRLALEWPLTAT